MRVIGVDPGYDRLGVAVMEKAEGKETLLYSGCVETNKQSTLPERIGELGKSFAELIKKYKDFNANSCHRICSWNPVYYRREKKR